MSLTNFTPFPGIKYHSVDQHKVPFHVVSARISYDICINSLDGQSTLVISPEQQPLNYNDNSYGDPITTSVQLESDLAPYKPKTDIIINGTAYSPLNKRVSAFDVTAQIGRYKKTLRINGPRQWAKNMFGWELLFAEPISSLPIRYEYSNGGHYQLNDKAFISPDNPIGMGWYPSEYLKQCDEIVLPAPQIESPDSPVVTISQSLKPEGFGFYGRSWRERIVHAGTYNQEWLDTRHPYLPDDFKFDYWCGAHPSLQIPHPKPGNRIPIKLFGLLPATEIQQQQIAFDIPVETIFIFLISKLGFVATNDMQLDTVVIDTNANKVFCTYRITVPEAIELAEVQLRFIEENKIKKIVKLPSATCAVQSHFRPVPPSLAQKGFFYG